MQLIPRRHRRARPGDPDNWARPCHVIGVAGTSPAMTELEMSYPTSPAIGFTALLSGNTAAASTASSSRR